MDRRLVPLLLAASTLLAGCTAFPSSTGGGGGPPAPVLTYRIHHVFVIVLENAGFRTLFGAGSPVPYLARNLTNQGRLLPWYYAIGHHSLPNYVAFLTGQAPNAATQDDCPTFANFTGSPDRGGQWRGSGCVYPEAVPSLPGELGAANLTWRAYAQGMANASGPGGPACRHPALGTQDPWQGKRADDLYATRHVPFLYLHQVIDRPSYCRNHVVDLRQLPADLGNGTATPNLVFITPDACADGHDSPCPNASRPGGTAGMNAFLRRWVPRILGSPAYQRDGLLVIVADEAPGDASACCGERPGPGGPLPGRWGPGGGRTGALLLAPCLPPNTTDPTPANHYGLLRTLADVLGVPRPGYAAQSDLQTIALPGCTLPPGANGTGAG